MQQVIYDFLLFFWEIGLQLPMPSRAMFITTLLALVLIFVMILLIPRILRFVIKGLSFIIPLINKYIFFLIISKLLETEFVRKNKLMSDVARAIDGLVAGIEEVIDWSNKKITESSEFLKKVWEKTIKVGAIIQILIIIWLIIPYSHIFQGTRVEKYINFALLNWNIAEKRINDITGLEAKVVLNSKRSRSKPETKYFKLNSKGIKGANIRKEPSLKRGTKIICEVTGTSVRLKYLKQKQVDSTGRLWYLVEAPNNKKGWISSSLVDKIN
jgi:hypothetical protein